MARAAEPSAARNASFEGASTSVASNSAPNQTRMRTGGSTWRARKRSRGLRASRPAKKPLQPFQQQPRGDDQQGYEKQLSGA